MGWVYPQYKELIDPGTQASSPVAAGSGASTTALQQRSVLEKLQEEMTKRLKATLDEVGPVPVDGSEIPQPAGVVQKPL